MDYEALKKACHDFVENIDDWVYTDDSKMIDESLSGISMELEVIGETQDEDLEDKCGECVWSTSPDNDECFSCEDYNHFRQGVRGSHG